MAKKVKKLRRKELLREDDFLVKAKSFMGRLLEHRKLLFSVAGAVVALVLLGIGISYYIKANEAKAIEHLAGALNYYKSYKKEVEKGAKNGAENKDKLEQAAKRFEEVSEAYPNRRQGNLALLYAAQCYYKKGDYETAVDRYGKLIDKIGGDPESSLLDLAFEGLGYSQEALGKFDEALGSYEKLAEKGGALFKQRGLMNAARIYLMKNDRKKALELYRQFAADFPDSINAPRIMRAIEHLGTGGP